MGAGWSGSGIRLECTWHLPPGASPKGHHQAGDVLSGEVRLLIPKRSKSLSDDFAGLVLALEGEGGGIVRERWITDFESTEVGDGIDFRFPFCLEVPSAGSGSPTSGSWRPGIPERWEEAPGPADHGDRRGGTLYKLRARLRRKPHVPSTARTNVWCDARPVAPAPVF